MEKTHKGTLGLSGWIVAIAKAQLVFLVTGLLLLLLATTIACQLDDPGSVLHPLAGTALCLSALAGGIAAVRFTEDGILSGLLSGTVSLALLRCLSLLPLPDSTLEIHTFIVFLCLVPIGAVCGAVVGKRRRKKKARSRK